MEIISVLKAPTPLPPPARDAGFYSVYLFLPPVLSRSALIDAVQDCLQVDCALHHAIAVAWRVHPYQFPRIYESWLIEQTRPTGVFWGYMLRLCLFLHPATVSRGRDYTCATDWLSRIVAPIRLKKTPGSKLPWEKLHRSVLAGIAPRDNGEKPDIKNPYQDDGWLMANFVGDLPSIRQAVQPISDLIDLALSRQDSTDVSEAWSGFITSYRRMVKQYASAEMQPVRREDSRVLVKAYATAEHRPDRRRKKTTARGRGWKEFSEDDAWINRKSTF